MKTEESLLQELRHYLSNNGGLTTKVINTPTPDSPAGWMRRRCAFNFSIYQGGFCVTHDKNSVHIIATAPSMEELVAKMDLLGWPKE